MNVTRINPAHVERELFSARLRKALKDARYSDSPTKVAREFNKRSSTPITSHAARKWLMGESIPRQQHIRLLADWLDTDVATLRYGRSDDIVTAGSIKPEDARLLDNLARLPHQDQMMFRKLVGLWAREPQEQRAA